MGPVEVCSELGEIEAVSVEGIISEGLGGAGEGLGR